jgi:glycosyltransferase involved in cell wall biosynthesis
LDLVYPFERSEFIRHVDRNTDAIFVFSEYWKQNLIDMRVSPDKVKVLYHGFNKDIFHKVSMNEARKAVGLKEDDFVVLNINRNAYRKAHDISIRAFLQFLKFNDFNANIKLFMNCHLNTREGYNILHIIDVECLKLNINTEMIVTNHIFIMGNRNGYATDEVINNLYNAADVGINTCMGEGFGLCNMEHAALGKPQVVSAVGALNDVFSQGSSFLIKPVVTMSVPNHLDEHNGDLHICSSDNFAEALNFYYKNPDIRQTDGENVEKYITEKYNWDTILLKFHEDFFKIME